MTLDIELRLNRLGFGRVVSEPHKFDIGPLRIAFWGRDAVQKHAVSFEVNVSLLDGYVAFDDKDTGERLYRPIRKFLWFRY